MQVIPSSLDCKQILSTKSKMLADVHCLPIFLLPFLRQTTTSTTREKNLHSYISFFEKKRNQNQIKSVMQAFP